jgi:hypothetical protein
MSESDQESLLLYPILPLNKDFFITGLHCLSSVVAGFTFRRPKTEGGMALILPAAHESPRRGTRS